MPALAKVRIVQHLRTPVSVHGQNLSDPAHLSIWQVPYLKIYNLICLIINLNLPVRRICIFPVPLIHNPRVAKFLEINGSSCHVLTKLPEFLFSADSLSIIKIFSIYIWLKGIGHVNGGRVYDKLQLYHITLHIPNNLAVSNTIRFSVTHNVLKYFFCHTIHI